MNSSPALTSRRPRRDSVFTNSQTLAGILLYPALLLGIVFSGCAPSAENSPGGGAAVPVGEGKLTVLATTGMIADAARQVGGEFVEVTALMGPGVDPHLYQPTARDQGRLRAARIVFYNGLHLEGRMADTFESLARSKTVVAISRDIPPAQLLRWAATGGMHDPHIWFDVRLWQSAIRTITATYVAADPAHQSDYERNSQRYLVELAALDQYCRQKVSELPPPRRLLITSHDAFHYLGRAYGLEVIGIQGISTESEAGLKEITDTVDLIKRRKLPAIFPESSVPPAAIQRVAADSGAQLGPELFSDALGGPESRAGTYVGMIRTNIEQIVNSLKDRAS